MNGDISKDKNILLTIADDGANFCGWQRQPGSRTVCGELEAVLTDLLKAPVRLNGTSRTDAGVHANGQAATLLTELGVPTEKVPMVFNTALADDRVEGLSDIRVLDAREMPEGFHARFDCKGKTYRYVIYSGEKDIFRRNYAYWVPELPDADKMRKGASYLVGTHDFKAFQSSGGNERETTVRTISDITISEDGKDIVIEITGDGFLYNMVRIITGTLLEMGTGKKDPEEMKAIIDSMDRSKAGHTAPAEGLYLKEIYF
jgi:tRNA pseudouridine38-40 synthase